VATHSINPWLTGDQGWLSGMGNFGRNGLLQALRREYRAKHPPKPGDLVWEIDEAHSIPEAVAYRAATYTIVPSVIGSSQWGGARAVYTAYFRPPGFPANYRERLRQVGRDCSHDCMERAQRHHERQQRPPRKSRVVDHRQFDGLFDDFKSRLGTADIGEVRAVETTDPVNQDDGE
jgi:hypothetical protein